MLWIEHTYRKQGLQYFLSVALLISAVATQLIPQAVLSEEEFRGGGVRDRQTAYRAGILRTGPVHFEFAQLVSSQLADLAYDS